MRFLMIIMVGTVFSIASCEQDPITGKTVCKPENRPEITDTGRVEDKRLKGKWELEDIRELGSKDFIDYQTLEHKSDTVKPLIHFKDGNKGTVVSNLGNKCSGTFEVVFGENKKWINVAKAPKNLFCTQIGGSPEMMDWEEKYGEVLANTTCYETTDNLLTIQYYVSEGNKGELIYKKKN